MTDFGQLLACLNAAHVEFIVIGGFAATAHGSAHLIVDLDDVYRRSYDALLPRSERRLVLGLECRFVDLPPLIHLKRAAGRPKDLERIAELEALEQERSSDRP